MNKTISPKIQARLEKIKQIAAESFLKNGYEATNLKDIIKQAGGSYSIVYESYQNKEGLFKAILDDFIEADFMQILKQINSKKHEKLEDFLFEFAKSYVEIFNDTKTIALARLIFSQIYNDNIKIGEWFKEESEKEAEYIIKKRFEDDKNPDISQNARFLAQTFCAMLRGAFFMQSVLENKVLMSKDQQLKHAKKVVKLFYQGVINFN